MPRTAAQPIDPKLPAHIRAAFERIDRECDPWYLPTFRISILGDAKLYVNVPRIREGALTDLGIKTREHGAVRAELRIKLRVRNAIARRRLAAMLIGERELARTAAIARRFAPQLQAAE